MNILISGSQIIPPRFVCLNCHKTYKNKRHLQRHQNYECGKEPQFQCPQCPYRAKLKENLRSHIAIRHTAFLINFK